MSLRYFHIVFISCSIALSFFMAYWSWQNLSATHQGLYLSSAAGALLTAGVLLYYLFYAVRKLRNAEKNISA